MKDIISAAAKAEVELSEAAAQKFEEYMRLLLEWNKKMNLTAITEREDIIQKHFADSLSALTLDIPIGASGIDIGAGAGFPSVPLAIVRGDIKFLMLDALGKRVTFLEECIERLGLKNASALHARAEDAAKGDLRESFDFALARAVAPMAVLVEYTLPFVKVGGFFGAMKGNSVEDELGDAKEAIKLLGGKTAEVREIKLFDFTHSIVKIEKIAPTAAKYPRKAGKIEKNPLKAN